MTTAAEPADAGRVDAGASGAAPVAPPSREDRILTVPNVVTALRLSCLPLFVYLLFGRDNRAAAAWLLAALGATDWIDGYVARHFHQVSALGKVLDPVADRLLFFVGIGAIVLDGSVPVWFAAATLTREVLVAGATLALAALGARRIDVTWYGKAGTFALMFAYPFFLAGNSTLGWHPVASVLAWAFGIPGLVLAWVAAGLYVPLARTALAEGRRGRAEEVRG
ncbi:MAG: CDP-alcohol phosphatidyltransferase family protein [Actinobacteria bacterium]|nr:CDP-alcohol phosphatidyltransferase family protein [Actinomycetota bacterium]